MIKFTMSCLWSNIIRLHIRLLIYLEITYLWKHCLSQCLSFHVCMYYVTEQQIEALSTARLHGSFMSGIGEPSVHAVVSNEAYQKNIQHKDPMKYTHYCETHSETADTDSSSAYSRKSLQYERILLVDALSLQVQNYIPWRELLYSGAPWL